MRPVLRPVRPAAPAAATSDGPGERSAAESSNGWLLSRGFLLCAAGPDGGLRAAPAWGVWLDGAVVFSTESGRVAPDDPHRFAATVVHLESADRVALVEGTAERLGDPALMSRFVAACEAKYGLEVDAGDPDKPVYILRPRGDPAQRGVLPSPT